jgi:hypothetical protein
VKATGGVVVETAPELWAAAAAARTHGSETATNFRNKCILFSQGVIVAAHEQSDSLRAIIINLVLWDMH